MGCEGLVPIRRPYLSEPIQPLRLLADVPGLLARMDKVATPSTMYTTAAMGTIDWIYTMVEVSASNT